MPQPSSDRTSTVAGSEVKHLAILGASPAGVAHAAVLAYQGHRVQLWDPDPERLAALSQAQAGFEPGLAELLRRGLAHRSLHVETDLAKAVREVEIVFLAPDCGVTEDGSRDLRSLEVMAKSMASFLTGHTLLVVKSAVPVGGSEQLLEWVLPHLRDGATVGLVSAPDFPRKGEILYGTLYPDRIVLGADDDADALPLFELYAPFECPIVLTSVRGAELSRLAAHAFLATKITFVQGLAHLCEHLGLEVAELGEALGLDRRIGMESVHSRPGAGSPAVFQDALALLNMADRHGLNFDLLRGALATHRLQATQLVNRVRARFGDLSGLRLGTYGLASQAHSHDIKDSHAIQVVRALLAEGAVIRAHDPAAITQARSELPPATHPNLVFDAHPYRTAEGADALLFLTEWPEFAQLNFARLAEKVATPILFDGRNFLPTERLKAAGFEVHAAGRPLPRMATISQRRRAQRTRAFIAP